MKKCIKCNEAKEISEFYKHPGMGDGHLNKCKDCCREEVKSRYRKKSESYQYILNERARGREKYRRLYAGRPVEKKIKREVIGKYLSRFPEKKRAYNTAKYKKRKYRGNHLHHWSYAEDHTNDVIELRPQYHSLIHRYLVYDQEFRYYRSLSGILLETKTMHYQYLLQVIKLYHQNKLK